MHFHWNNQNTYNPHNLSPVVWVVLLLVLSEDHNNNLQRLICHKTKQNLTTYMYKEDLALNNLQRLICHKTKPNRITTTFVSVINYYHIYGLHLFWDTLYIKQKEFNTTAFDALWIFSFLFILTVFSECSEIRFVIQNFFLGKKINNIFFSLFSKFVVLIKEFDSCLFFTAPIDVNILKRIWEIFTKQKPLLLQRPSCLSVSCSLSFNVRWIFTFYRKCVLHFFSSLIFFSIC